MTASGAPKAIILAAGEGTRLRPYTLDRPKCMVEVDGRSLLDCHLAVLGAEGVSDIVLVGGYRSEMLRRPNIAMHLNPGYADTNMVWSLFAAEAELNGPTIIAYGDIVYSRGILRSVLASTADIAVAIDLDWEAYWRARNEDPIADAETLKMAVDGRLLEVGQKPTSLAEIEGQYMGLMKFSAAGIETLKQKFHAACAGGGMRGKPVEKAYMTDMLQSLIDDGHRLQSVPVRGAWVEVDTVDDLLASTTLQRLSAIAGELQD